MFKKGDPIGTGAERNVFTDINNPSRVIKERKPESRDHESRYLRAQGYFAKILHGLLPQNIPDTYVSTPRVLLVERKILDDLHRTQAELKLIASNNQVKQDELRKGRESFELVFKNYERTGEMKTYMAMIECLEKRIFALGIEDLDSSIHNFGRDAENNMVYIDTIRPWCYSYLPDTTEIKKNYDPKKIRQAIELLPEDEKKRLTRLVERLESLFDEEAREKHLHIKK